MSDANGCLPQAVRVDLRECVAVSNDNRIAIQPVQYWLADIDRYGNAKLVDGSHSDRAGADKAAALFARLGLGQSRTYAVARVELSPVQEYRGALNEEAIRTLNESGLKP
jgi:hypothetical protein